MRGAHVAVILDNLAAGGGRVELLAGDPSLEHADIDAAVSSAAELTRERVVPIRTGALEIRVAPGDAHTVRNAPLRAVPARGRGRLAIEVTITHDVPPTQQYEQAGITWYHNGKPVLKLVQELVDGHLMIIPGRARLDSQTVQLRLIVTADRWTAQYRPDAQGDFLPAGEGTLPPPGNDQVSLQCYHGPPDGEHCIRFDDFRIRRLAD